MEGKEDKDAQDGWHDVVDEVPDEVGDPVDVGLDARDELELFNVGLAFPEKKDEKAGRYEGKREYDEDRDC